LVTFHKGRLRGSVGVPGDKSISHRALIAGARCDAPLVVSNLNLGRDVEATRDALVALGVRIESAGNEHVVHPASLTDPRRTLDCMNSGSTVRMLLGACAGAGIAARFDGDESLRRRPMEPVAAQLRAFGAKIETSAGCLPAQLAGTPQIETRHFILLSPSAQIKSALLFAGLFAGVPVMVDGDRGSRDHTERLLAFLGATIEWDRRSVNLGAEPLQANAVEVAGDFSSAAFFVTAAAITPGSSIIIRNAGVNPTRTGLLDALAQMGGAIELRNPRNSGGEPIADIAVEYRPLRATAIDSDLALRAIDELPLLAIAAAFATGTTTIAGIEPLRSKESDRVAAIERLLGTVGIEIKAGSKSLAIAGGTPVPGGEVLQTHDDHRIVMAAAVLACAAGPLAVDSDTSLDVSFPGFARALQGLRVA
jgi:3-phosphoshikimate 1-carboxyvinyltransferase